MAVQAHRAAAGVYALLRLTVLALPLEHKQGQSWGGSFLHGLWDPGIQSCIWNGLLTFTLGASVINYIPCKLERLWEEKKTLQLN